MTISNNPDTTVYFFDPDKRKILRGRFLRNCPIEGPVIAVRVDHIWIKEDYYKGPKYKFTNNHKEAIKNGMDFLNAEIKNLAAQVSKTYKEKFDLKWSKAP